MSLILSVSGSAANRKRLAVGFAILSATFLTGCALLPIGGDDSDNTDNGWATVRLVNSNGSTTEWSVSDRADAGKLGFSHGGESAGLKHRGQHGAQPLGIPPATGGLSNRGDSIPHSNRPSGLQDHLRLQDVAVPV